MSNAQSLPDLTGKTICQLVPRLELGGAERSTLEIAEAITQAGGHALVVSEGGGLVSDLQACGGRWINAPIGSKNPLTMRRTATWLRHLIEREDIDLLHARSRAPAWVAQWALKGRQDMPFVTTYHGAYSARSHLKQRYNAIMVSGDITVANSDWTANEIRRQFSVDEAKLVTIWRGANPRFFDPDRLSDTAVMAQRNDWLSRLGRNETTDIDILFLPARVSSWKGQAVAIDALAAHLRTSERQAILVLAGQTSADAEFVRSLEQKIAAHCLEAHVLLTAPSKDMPTALAAADIVLAPSTRPEAFGRIAIEAGFMARPVIVPDIGAAEETVEHAVTGYRVAPNDPSALAQAIGTILAMSLADRKQLGQRARARCQQYFTLDGMKAKTLSVYDKLLNYRDEGC